jgi:hypothetical protein
VLVEKITQILHYQAAGNRLEALLEQHAAPLPRAADGNSLR